MTMRFSAFLLAGVCALAMSGSASAATDGFGNDNFKGSYFDNQAPAALADDKDADMNNIAPAAGGDLPKDTTATPAPAASSASQPDTPVQTPDQATSPGPAQQKP
jgi:hypothetical protein